ncbi:rab11 family-interacting protein 1-like [Cyprinus carpio]|nr:rab11 family-interacting protein 1-like [Cyprinus carpio]
MTNMELIALLLQQEMDVKKQQAETEVQVALLEKRDAELKKMKVQVRDLEDYIDKLLVRIMEQTPTLLQVRARPK